MRIPADNAAEFLTRIVPYVDSDGARNLNAICRQLSIPYQTIRFRMNRLKDQGISVLPNVDIAKLGLQRIKAVFELNRDIEDPKVILGGLHQKAGLKYYSRVLFSQEMECEFLVPDGGISEFDKLLRALEEMKLIKNVRYNRLLWKEVFMMKTKYFDYESGEWDVDFSRLSGDPSTEVPKPVLGETRFDYDDLLIIKSLELDPWIKVVDLAKKVNLPVGDVSYHLNRHVFGRKLIPSFRLRWIGTKDAWSKHSIVAQSFVFGKLTGEEVRHVMSIMSATPFIWDHMLSEDGTYTTELTIPLSHFPETQSHISQKLRMLGIRPEVRYKDWSLSSVFTIPYTMYERGKGWALEAETALSYVLQMISQYDKKS
jgi:DNA-binding Lrp family transcriptional regulator